MNESVQCHVRVLNFAPNVVMQNSFCWIEKHLKTQSFITLVFQNPAVIPSQAVFGPLEGIWKTRVSWDAGIIVKDVSRLQI